MKLKQDRKFIPRSKLKPEDLSLFTSFLPPLLSVPVCSFAHFSFPPRTSFLCLSLQVHMSSFQLRGKNQRDFISNVKFLKEGFMGWLIPPWLSEWDHIVSGCFLHGRLCASAAGQFLKRDLLQVLSAYSFVWSICSFCYFFPFFLFLGLFFLLPILHILNMLILLFCFLKHFSSCISHKSVQKIAIILDILNRNTEN